jgi:hypothetical protein
MRQQVKRIQDSRNSAWHARGMRLFTNLFLAGTACVGAIDRVICDEPLRER